ncbi:MAG: iron-containing alcohol dehydrogenase [Bryobacterales bacterium]|nr:iron-containing alcohol dehydrogenase [Bryobacterales bacterium]
MRFEFATATRIVFGEGSVREAPEAVRRFATRALLVTGRDPARIASLRDGIEQAGVALQVIAVEGEPTVDFVRQAVESARTFSAGVVVAVGGGSVLDAGKAIAAMLSNPGDPLDYLEVIGAGRALPHSALPLVAVPTTAGTGSEVTRNAVLGSPQHGVKASLRSPGMLPALAIVDPLLTLDLPPALTASTGLDALTQVIEPFLCSRANPMTDLFCEEGIRCVARWLLTAYRDGQHTEARTGMAWASLLGGLALANAGLGVVHAFASPIGGAFPAPHGAVCAALLPHGLHANLEALRAEDSQHPRLARFARVAALLTGNDSAPAEAAVDQVRMLVTDLAIPGLNAYGVAAQHATVLAEKALRTSSMTANPAPLGQSQMEALLRAAL